MVSTLKSAFLQHIINTRLEERIWHTLACLLPGGLENGLEGASRESTWCSEITTPSYHLATRKPFCESSRRSKVISRHHPTLLFCPQSRDTHGHSSLASCALYKDTSHKRLALLLRVSSYKEIQRVVVCRMTWCSAVWRVSSYVKEGQSSWLWTPGTDSAIVSVTMGQAVLK